MERQQGGRAAPGARIGRRAAVLFLDLKGSTALWSERPAAAMRVVDAVHGRVQRLAELCGGLLVKAIGDAFMLAFARLDSAVAFAVRFQAACLAAPSLAQPGSRVLFRVGIAYGPVLRRRWRVQGCDVDDFFGATVNTAARLESEVAEPGGVAVAALGEASQAALRLVQEQLAGDAGLAPHVAPGTLQSVAFRAQCRGEGSRQPSRSRRQPGLPGRPDCRDVRELRGVHAPLECLTWRCQA